MKTKTRAPEWLLATVLLLASGGSAQSRPDPMIGPSLVCVAVDEPPVSDEAWVGLQWLEHAPTEGDACAVKTVGSGIDACRQWLDAGSCVHIANVAYGLSFNESFTLKGERYAFTEDTNATTEPEPAPSVTPPGPVPTVTSIPAGLEVPK